MPRSTLVDLARRAIADWRAYWERRQRQARFARLCRVAPELSAAHEALRRDRQQHRPTRADLAAIRQAMSARLRREITHG